MSDNVYRPAHYSSHPSGVECIELARHLPFALGNALKYIWRAGQKIDRAEDLEKAQWYITDAVRTALPLRPRRRVRQYLLQRVEKAYAAEPDPIKREAIKVLVLDCGCARKKREQVISLGAVAGMIAELQNV